MDGRRLGWDMTSWFGQFAFVATAVLACAVLMLAGFDLPRAGHRVTLSGGETNRVSILGADIGGMPDARSLRTLAGTLKVAVKDLPWDRALVHHAVKGSRVADSLFFPVNGIGEAFALCAKLAKIPPDCSPAVATSDELRTFVGDDVTPASLRQLGIAPYQPVAQRSRLAALAGYDAIEARTF